VIRYSIGVIKPVVFREEEKLKSERKKAIPL